MKKLSLAAAVLFVTLGLVLHYARAQVISTSGSSSGINGPGQGQIDYATGKRWGMAAPLTTTATVLTAVGMTAPSFSSPGGAAGANVQFARPQIFCATTAAIGSSCGIDGPYTETRASFGPIYYATTYGPAQTNMRLWYALASIAGCGTNVALSTGPTAQANVMVGIGYQTTFNSGRWAVCSGDGTNLSCVDTGVAPVISPVSTTRVKLDWSNQASFVATLWESPVGAADAWVQKFSVTKTTNLSTSSTTDMGICHQANALDAAQKNAYFSAIELQQNN